MRRLGRVNRRWIAPVAVIAVIVASATLPKLLTSAGGSSPGITTLDPAGLLAKASAPTVDAYSGQVRLVSDLGLPALSGLVGGGGGGANLVGLLSGTHVARVWATGADHLRVALPSALAETDWVRNGTDVWSWDSASQDAVHATAVSTGGGAALVVQTPAQLARSLINDVTATTAVSIGAPSYVAGRAAYELRLAPRIATSTIAVAAISVDAATGIALDVRITATGAKTPAFEYGFTHVSFATPKPSDFAFTPPSGAHVFQVGDPSAMLLGRQRRRYEGDGGPASANAFSAITTVGDGWTAVDVIPSSGRFGRFESAALLTGAKRVGTGPSSGTLIATPLVNLLLLDDGRILAGAVTPTALDAAAR